MQTYTLVSVPIDHLPIVLYDKDFHCVDDSHYHITEQTCVIDACLSNWNELPGTRPYLEFNSYEGFMILKSLRPIDIDPITMIVTVSNDENFNHIKTAGTEW